MSVVIDQAECSNSPGQQSFQDHSDVVPADGMPVPSDGPTVMTTQFSLRRS